MDRSRIYRPALIAVTAVIIIVSSLYLLRIIEEPDFFWHLKTGEWIWDNKSLPGEDPFSYTTPATYSVRKHFILTSYWLAQIVYYLVYLAFELPGIIFLRLIFICFLIYILIKREHGNDLLYLSLLLIFLILFFERFTLDRPQSFSFVFFALLLYLIEKIRGGTKVAAFFIPFLMLIWANTHGGHILGQVTLTIYIVFEGLKFAHRSAGPVSKEAYLRLLVAGVLGIALSLINPNTYHVLPEVLRMPAFMTADNMEYQSVLTKLFSQKDYTFLLYIFIVLLAISGLIIRLKKTDITELVLLAGLCFFSMTTSRYVPFFIIAAIPSIGRALAGEKILRWCLPPVIIISLLAAGYFGFDERRNLDRPASGRWTSNFYSPEKAVEFILQNNIRGNMYNYYNYGGYLIWRLAPERKVFIDGRMISEEVLSQSVFIQDVYAAQKGGLPGWKFLLNVHNVNYIVIPVFEPSGRVLPLVRALVMDRDWIPVFFSLNSLIFVKDSPENYAVMMRHAIPKTYLAANIPFN